MRGRESVREWDIKRNKAREGGRDRERECHKNSDNFKGLHLFLPTSPTIRQIWRVTSIREEWIILWVSKKLMKFLVGLWKRERYGWTKVCVHVCACWFCHGVFVSWYDIVFQNRNERERGERATLQVWHCLISHKFLMRVQMWSSCSCSRSSSSGRLTHKEYIFFESLTYSNSKLFRPGTNTQKTWIVTNIFFLSV